jgi:hypothetical protein
MRRLDTNFLFATSIRANLCLAIIPAIILWIGQFTPAIVALSMASIALAVIACFATALLFVRNDQQKRFVMALAGSLPGRR